MVHLASDMGTKGTGNRREFLQGGGGGGGVLVVGVCGLESGFIAGRWTATFHHTGKE